MKAHIVHEAQFHDNAFVFAELECDGFPFMWHYHSNFEIFIPTSNTGTAIVGDHLGEFTGGEMLYFVGVRVPHVFYSVGQMTADHPWQASLVRFKEEVPDELMSAFPETAELQPLFTRSASGILYRKATFHAVMPLIERLRQQQISGVDSFITFIELLRLLNDADDYELLATPGYTLQATQYDTDRIDRILAYLHQHYQGKIRLDDVANEVGSSISNLCAFFRKATGQTVLEYVNKLRISHACQQLRETNLLVSDIALQAGFSNLGHFNRQFKSLKHLTPRQFRKRFAQ